MSTSAPLSPTEVAAMLERLTIPEVQDRLDQIDAERAMLSRLIQILRVRQSAPRRKSKEAAQCQTP